MLCKQRIIPLALLIALMMACGTPVSGTSAPGVSIARHPEPVDYSGIEAYTSPPRYDPNSSDPFQPDLRSTDLTQLDLSGSREDLLHATFDSKTVWPAQKQMPADFNWQQIMETGKNPGLGLRKLHAQGITGAGVGIAIIDQTLLVDHVEYKERLTVYEEAEDVIGGWKEAQMHGPAVASIAVGKTIGVAPQADLYYIATGDCGGATSWEDFDFSCRAAAIHRIITINKGLPTSHRIRVLSMAFGWSPESQGYAEITAAVKEAKAAGIFVISSSLNDTDGLRFDGLGRDPLKDPEAANSFEPGVWWAERFYTGKYGNQPMLLVPMDARTTASPTGYEDYVFYRQGGWSWAIPYLAGVYALAAQVKPDITPEEFWRIALETGKTIPSVHNGETYQLGVILDPVALIEALK